MSIADLGEVTEEKLLRASQISRNRLIVALVFRLFLISLVIIIIDLFVLIILWEKFIIFVNFSWLLLLEAGLIFTWAGLGGSIKTSISINKLFQLISKGKETINKDIINKALGNTISLSVLGIYLIIYSIIISSLGYNFFYT